MNSSMDCRKLMAIVGAFYWFILVAVCVPVACVSTLFIFIYPTMLFSVSLFNRLEHALCRMVNDVWVAAGQYTGLNMTEYGDDITDYADKRCLCLVNHLGLTDHFCLMTAFYDKKSLSGRYIWVIFNIWKFTSLGVMWIAHGNFFINGGVAYRDKMLADFREHLIRNYRKHDYGWIVMYPEGSRLFLIKESEVKYCQKNELTPFRHCAHPRTGAAFSALNVCAMLQKDTKGTQRDDARLEYIVDCTLGYPKGRVVLLNEAMLGDWPNDDTNIAMHFRVHKIQPEWQTDETKFRMWLFEQYKQKDDLLDGFYRNGRFPGVGRPIHFPLSRNVMVQAFWLALFYFHYNFWLRPLAACLLKFLWNIVANFFF